MFFSKKSHQHPKTLPENDIAMVLGGMSSQLLVAETCCDDSRRKREESNASKTRRQQGSNGRGNIKKAQDFNFRLAHGLLQTTNEMDTLKFKTDNPKS